MPKKVVLLLALAVTGCGAAAPIAAPAPSPHPAPRVAPSERQAAPTAGVAKSPSPPLAQPPTNARPEGQPGQPGVTAGTSGRSGVVPVAGGQPSHHLYPVGQRAPWAALLAPYPSPPKPNLLTSQPNATADADPHTGGEVPVTQLPLAPAPALGSKPPAVAVPPQPAQPAGPSRPSRPAQPNPPEARPAPAPAPAVVLATFQQQTEDAIRGWKHRRVPEETLRRLKHEVRHAADALADSGTDQPTASMLQGKLQKLAHRIAVALGDEQPTADDLTDGSAEPEGAGPSPCGNESTGASALGAESPAGDQACTPSKPDSSAPSGSPDAPVPPAGSVDDSKPGDPAPPTGEESQPPQDEEQAPADTASQRQAPPPPAPASAASTSSPARDRPAARAAVSGSK